MLMKVHTSNYAIQGFTAAVPEAELAELAHATAAAVRGGSGQRHAGGSGALRPAARADAAGDACAAGADLVTFSGDKLLGGPQAGILVGRAS